MNRADAALCLDLLTTRRWAALATIGTDGPFASMVAFALDRNRAAVLLHLSTLAPHTANLTVSGRAGLVVSQPDDGTGDPQTLARLSLTGAVTPVDRDDPAYPAARRRYLERLPTAEPLFAFGDFRLFSFGIARAHFVGGFARAHQLPGQQFTELLGGLAD